MEEESLVASDVLNSLSQLLSNLILGNNTVRAEAEKILNEQWLSNKPELVLLALSQLILRGQDENMRSFAAVLLRRFCFRKIDAEATSKKHGNSVYDAISDESRGRVEQTLLKALTSETEPSVRRKVIDTVADIALESLERGRPWGGLQKAAFVAVESSSDTHREIGLQLLSRVPQLILDQDCQIVIKLLEGGLQQTRSLETRLAALKASCAYLSSADVHTRAQAAGLIAPMLESLMPLSHSDLVTFLQTLTPLATTQPILFQGHLSSLLTFLIPLILTPLPSSHTAISEATPTVGNPRGAAHPLASAAGLGMPNTPTAANPSGTSTSLHSPPHFLFPPPSSPSRALRQGTSHSRSSSLNGKALFPPPLIFHPSPEDEARDDMRRTALEFLISLSEARPGMVKACDGWVNGVVRCCMEGMSEVRDGEGDGTTRWLEVDDPAEDDDDFGFSHVFEECLDRLACAVGGRSLLPVAFQYIPALLASHDWMHRHAALLAIAAIAEGTHRIMELELPKIVGLVIPAVHDLHPRVRYAVCQCLGQLCTDLEEVFQNRHHQEVFAALHTLLGSSESRVRAHAAAAVINFCNGVDGDTLNPYISGFVTRLVEMLTKDRKLYVQEQAITTLAMVADAAAEAFCPHYRRVMPLLLNILQQAEAAEHHSLRCKVMECAGLMAIAVGPESFNEHATEFIDTMLAIQQSLIGRHENDMTSQYVISTWAKICQALGPSFESYMPQVMPLILRSAGAKADIAVVEDKDGDVEREGFEIIEMQGQRVEIRTSSLEEKCTAFDALLIICTVLDPGSFASYVDASLSLALPALRFYYHEGVREASAMLIPALVSCSIARSLVLGPELARVVFTPLIECIHAELDTSFLASLYKCFSDCLLLFVSDGSQRAGFEMLTNGSVVSLGAHLQAGFVRTTQNQLFSIASKRQIRMDRVRGRDWADEKEEMILLDEMEDFALEEMQKCLQLLSGGDMASLMIAVGSVRQLGIRTAFNSDNDSEYSESEDD